MRTPITHLFAALLWTLGSGPQEPPQNDAPKQLDPPTTPRHDPAADAKRFDELDLNHDGVLSMEEAGKDAALASAFAALDRNGDGKISREEYEQR